MLDIKLPDYYDQLDLLAEQVVNIAHLPSSILDLLDADLKRGAS